MVKRKPSGLVMVSNDTRDLESIKSENQSATQYADLGGNGFQNGTER